MEIIDADENLKFIREQLPSLSEQQKKQWFIPAIIDYAESLRRAIAEDDLISMRLYECPDRFLESFESAANKIRNPESMQRTNDNFSACDPEDDEDIEDDLDEECSETEQDEGEEISETEDEPEEDLQLTFF